ncbi:MAG: DUF2268 domain-containing putative Zn-dependent protease [Candidatus Microsaccharimonas sp.]
MNINYFESKYWDTAAEKGLDKEAVRQVIDTATNEAASHLPALSPYLNISVIPDADETIPETGEGGYTWSDERVAIYFDPDVPYGTESLKNHLRSTVFHELNHAARAIHIPYTRQPIEALVAEGLATNFERLYTKSNPLWGQYEDDKTMQTWLKEVLALEEGVRHTDYLYDHPDGRKWIIYKTGTWLVDRVLKESNHSIQDLTIMPAQSLVNLIND